MNSSTPIRFASIGDDEAIIELLLAADRVTTLDLVACHDVTAQRSARFYEQLKPLAAPPESQAWESLLGGVVA
ncbi:MAG: hypothetical protein KDB23_34350, partial [Planctomycetales bacterium]|nr:hypothetical protein [Planctomycetales bacterium]